VLKTIIKNLVKGNHTAFEFDYTIKRSQRKTLCVQIKHGAVNVMAPKRLPQAEILYFLRQKQTWILNKLSLQQNLHAQLEQAKTNPTAFSMGVLKTIVTRQAPRFNLLETGTHIELTIPHRIVDDRRDLYINKQLSDWYKQRAAAYLPQRLALISAQVSLYPQQLQIKQYKARWGSCNTKGVISLNSLLMMTPEFVIDYVIIHELCHLQHMNHSVQFWRLVATHCPPFKQAKAWLKENKIQLHSFHR